MFNLIDTISLLIIGVFFYISYNDKFDTHTLLYCTYIIVWSALLVNIVIDYFLVYIHNFIYFYMKSILSSMKTINDFSIVLSLAILMLIYMASFYLFDLFIFQKKIQKHRVLENILGFGIAIVLIMINYYNIEYLFNSKTSYTYIILHPLHNNIMYYIKTMYNYIAYAFVFSLMVLQANAEKEARADAKKSNDIVNTLIASATKPQHKEAVDKTSKPNKEKKKIKTKLINKE